MDHTYSVRSVQISSNERTPEAYYQLDQIIVDFMQQQDITGGSLAICFHGNLIYTQGYGLANSGLKALSSSLFRLASISKTITAVSILKLVEDGKLKLDQKIFGQNGILKKYKPSGKGDKRLLKITVRHLLQHSGGWDRDQVGDAVFWKLPKKKNDDSYSDEALIRYMLSRKLQFTPGKRHAYSNLGYLILGKVIEEVKYFNNRENILEPSVFEGEGSVPAQYGGFKMEGTGSYGGLVMSVVELLAFFNQINRVQTQYLGVIVRAYLENEEKISQFKR
ncbi:Hypothetical predicted protein [Mytilus galloprovincialis]|uniref:Beta-lactamase-related domain-containing protein n=1 Tax=Mytilus galloprovincialis TaxID=29158 RepID=A0A8B6FNB0_MYTGA|nr:Hypothetical predicted protein [Mytilus galloprovincialis]